MDWQAIIVGGMGFGAIVPTSIWLLRWAAKRQDKIVEKAMQNDEMRTAQFIAFLQDTNAELKEDRRAMREIISAASVSLDRNTEALSENSKAVKKISEAVESLVASAGSS